MLHGWWAGEAVHRPHQSALQATRTLALWLQRSAFVSHWQTPFGDQYRKYLSWDPNDSISQFTLERERKTWRIYVDSSKTARPALIENWYSSQNAWGLRSETYVQILLIAGRWLTSVSSCLSVRDNNRDDYEDNGLIHPSISSTHTRQLKHAGGKAYLGSLILHGCSQKCTWELRPGLPSVSFSSHQSNSHQSVTLPLPELIPSPKTSLRKKFHITHKHCFLYILFSIKYNWPMKIVCV